MECPLAVTGGGQRGLWGLRGSCTGVMGTGCSSTRRGRGGGLRGSAGRLSTGCGERFHGNLPRCLSASTSHLARYSGMCPTGTTLASTCVIHSASLTPSLTHVVAKSPIDRLCTLTWAISASDNVLIRGAQCWYAGGVIDVPSLTKTSNTCAHQTPSRSHSTLS